MSIGSPRPLTSWTLPMPLTTLPGTSCHFRGRETLAVATSSEAEGSVARLDASQMVGFQASTSPMSSAAGASPMERSPGPCQSAAAKVSSTSESAFTSSLKLACPWHPSARISPIGVPLSTGACSTLKVCESFSVTW